MKVFSLILDSLPQLEIKTRSILTRSKGYTINRGKVAFADSGTVLCYYIGQTFLATFRSDLDLLQAYNWDTDRNTRYK